MCNVLLPPGVDQIAVNKYIIYQNSKKHNLYVIHLGALIDNSYNEPTKRKNA